MPRAWISLGANLGRPQATLTAAAKALEQSEGIAHLRLSSFYSTSPVDSSGPDYVNAAAAVDTNCSPEALLKLLQRIEYAHGRVRPAGVRNAPRTLDLDLLAYEGDDRLTGSRFRIPGCMSGSLCWCRSLKLNQTGGVLPAFPLQNLSSRSSVKIPLNTSAKFPNLWHTFFPPRVAEW